MTPEMVSILKLHKRWADRYTLLWQGFTLALLTGFQLILDYIGVAASERTPVVVLLACMVIVAAIWQAAGLTMARLHMLLRNIDLDR